MYKMEYPYSLGSGDNLDLSTEFSARMQLPQDEFPSFGLKAIDKPEILDDTSPSLTPDADCVSDCSQDCKSCCEDEDCDEECPKSCEGFVDCDDAPMCTKLDCGEVSCTNIAQPCFDSGCLQLSQADIEAAVSLTATPPLPTNPEPWYLAPTQSFDVFLGSSQTPTGGASLEFPQQTSWIQNSELDTDQAIEAPPMTDDLSATLDYAFPPSKRLRTQDDQKDHLSSQYPYVTQQDTLQLELDSAIGCHWGSNCPEEFFEWNAFNNHIYSDHVKPQQEIHCKWNDCEESTDKDTILTHVKRKHGLDNAKYTCRWDKCNATFDNVDDLKKHLDSMHLPGNALYCEWDACGACTQDPQDLSMHLQIKHWPDASALPLDIERSEGSPKLASVGPKMCEWVVSAEVNDASKTCGLTFENAEELQLHVKDVHINFLKKKTGFFCRWANCNRYGSQPFSQRGKLERHLQVHTGCMLYCLPSE
jgi:hypothetical protein